MKRILIITYNWPPATGANVQRMLAFCRYLPEFGFHPIVLTPRRPADGISDIPKLHHETASAFDPVARLRLRRHKGTGATEREAKRWMEWIRLNLMIPDTKIAWRRPAGKKARKLIADFRPVAVLTTAPPYTVHLIGLDLKNRCGLPWIADFRDPWLENHAYNTTPRNKIALGLNRRMEAAVLNRADHVTCVQDSQYRLLSRKTDRTPDSAWLTKIRNGYDPADFPPDRPLRKTFRFHLSHFGTVYDSGLDRDFFRQLSGLVNTNAALKKSFSLRMIGPISRSTRAFLKSLFAPDNLHLRETIPHNEIVSHLRDRQLLLLLVNRGSAHRYSLPSKVYEYLASGNPVLAAGPSDHEVMSILRETRPDRAAIADSDSDWKDFFLGQFAGWRNDTLPRRTDPPEEFNWRNLTGKLARIFVELTVV